MEISRSGKYWDGTKSSESIKSKQLKEGPLALIRDFYWSLSVSISFQEHPGHILKIVFNKPTRIKWRTIDLSI